MSLSLIVSGWACDQSWDRKCQGWEFCCHYQERTTPLSARVMQLAGWQPGISGGHSCSRYRRLCPRRKPVDGRRDMQTWWWWCAPAMSKPQSCSSGSSPWVLFLCLNVVARCVNLLGQSFFSDESRKCLLVSPAVAL